MPDSFRRWITVAVAPFALGACAASAPGPASESGPAAATSVPAPESSTPASAFAAPSAPASETPLPTGGSVLVGEIAGPPGFDAKSVLDGAKPQLLACYNQARQRTPALRGKVKLRISVNEAGTVLGASAEPGGSAADPGFAQCLEDALKTVKFPKPGGSATVTAPLVFRP